MSKEKARKVGRPPLPKGDAKDEFLRVRVTASELRAIESESKRHKKTPSEWVRGILNASLRG